MNHGVVHRKLKKATFFALVQDCEPAVNHHLVHKKLKDASFGDCFLARWRYLRYFLVPGPRVSQNGFLGCVSCEPAFWLWGQVHATYVRPKKACFRLRESRGGKPGAGFTQSGHVLKFLVIHSLFCDRCAQVHQES